MRVAICLARGKCQEKQLACCLCGSDPLPDPVPEILAEILLDGAKILFETGHIFTVLGVDHTLVRMPHQSDQDRFGDIHQLRIGAERMPEAVGADVANLCFLELGWKKWTPT